jgi:hypothetical protein
MSAYRTEVLANVTDGTDGTYHYYLDMLGWKRGSFYLSVTGGSGTCTATIEGANQVDGTAQDLKTYDDITNDTFGVTQLQATTGTTETADWVDNADKLGGFTDVRIQIVAATSGSNDADWIVRSRQNG